MTCNDFQQYETVRSYGAGIFTSEINIDEAEKDQSNLLENLVELNGRSRPKTVEDKLKRTLWKCICYLWR